MSYDYLSNARLIGETFEQYKQRRKLANMIVKQHLKGKHAEPGEESTEESN